KALCEQGAWVFAKGGVSGQGDEAVLRVFGGGKGLDVFFRLLPGEPAESGDDGAGQEFRVVVGCGVQHGVGALLMAAAEGEHGSGKDLARFLVDQGVLADFPARFACYAQAVQVGFYAVVQAGKVFEVVMRFVDCAVTEEPEKGGVFGVLGYDVFYDHYINELLNC
ncbi:MAG: hypothetical protein D3917_20475, partial [Candidatus Electrothrix sp. AX5]|nr:hypothetical protein [Candidatus Electrothrix sp. AX5]